MKISYNWLGMIPIYGLFTKDIKIGEQVIKAEDLVKALEGLPWIVKVLLVIFVGTSGKVG